MPRGIGIPRLPMYLAVGTIVPSALVYFGMKPFSMSDDELRRELEKKYPKVVKKQREQNEKMKDFFTKMRSNDPEQQEEFRRVMYQGNKAVKPRQESEYQGSGSDKAEQWKTKESKA
eukprot:CAMPEP_0118878770 /NCGR_PEP_ID=MMETSP1163-20130328/18654_1 /TAXON_ID=124430 /ORGANISM="Phaeomonas parva, Strain CCMP2877" /LENGTH=116 /DNA_ID=CAMNT_0006814711 /DNA_START=180 /DNA_END=530 /DNA_ORIENTATION=-